MSAVTIAIIDPFHPAIIRTIEQALPADWSLSIAKGRSLTEHEGAMREADAAFVMATPVPSTLIVAAPRLGLIQKLGAGVDRIDLETCRERGVGVARLFAGNAIPVAEHTLMLMLSLYRRLPLLDRNTRAGLWEKEEVRGINRHMNGKTVGIIGFGAVGRQVARLLSGFGVEILYFDPMRAQATVEADLRAEYAKLDDLVARSDIVTLHLPLMKETAGLIDRRRIGLMKRDATLINCARGGLIDEEALAQALRDGRLFGAALDAFSQEPPIGSPLLELEQAIVTPHAAGATLDNIASIAARAVANTQRYLAGEELPSGDVVIAPRRRSRVA